MAFRSLSSQLLRRVSTVRRLPSVLSTSAVTYPSIAIRSFTTSLATRNGGAIKVQAAVARAPGQPFTFDELTLRAPKDDEILVKIHATGVCHTDIAVKDRNLCAFPMVLGHEGVGVVEKIGSRVTTVKPGDHVMMSYASCGGCPHCNTGKPAYCYDHGFLNFAGKHKDGSVDHHHQSTPIQGTFFRQSSFATYSLCTENNCFPVAKDLPLATLAPLNCGIQTGAGAVMNTFKCGAGTSIAVFGCGAVGMSAIMAAKVVGCTTVVALDLTESRLALAKELGATHTIRVDKADTPAKTAADIKALTGAGAVGVDYALETSGNRFALRAAFDSLKPLGQCGLIGGAAPGVEVSLEMLSMLNGKQMRGIIQGDSVSKVFVPQLIALWQAGRFPYDKLITFYDGMCAHLFAALGCCI